MNEQLVPAQPDVRALEDLHTDLLAWVSELEAGDCVSLDVDDEKATQPAVQLMLATERALREKCVLVSLGDRAARILETVLTPGEN